MAREGPRRRSRGFRQDGHSCSTWPERRGPWCSRGAVQLMSSPSTTSAVYASNGLRRGKARSNGHGCHVGRSPPTRFVFSFTHSLTISEFPTNTGRRRSRTGKPACAFRRLARRPPPARRAHGIDRGGRGPSFPFVRAALRAAAETAPWRGCLLYLAA